MAGKQTFGLFSQIPDFPLFSVNIFCFWRSALAYNLTGVVRGFWGESVEYSRTDWWEKEFNKEPRLWRWKKVAEGGELRYEVDEEEYEGLWDLIAIVPLNL